MNIVKNLGMLLLAIYLIVAGLIGLFGMSLGPTQHTGADTCNRCGCRDLDRQVDNAIKCFANSLFTTNVQGGCNRYDKEKYSYALFCAAYADHRLNGLCIDAHA